MDWLNYMNEAIDYIEKRLDDEVDYNEAAKIACCSLFHFQRTFSFIAGIGLSDYVRQRRMTLAAFDLLNSSEKVIDIALKYGYTSPTAFTRAFISMHGIAPSMVRVHGIPLSSYPRITFHLSIKGGKEMKYRIEEKPAMRFVGKKEAVSNVGGANYVRIPQIWQEVDRDGLFEKIMGLSNTEPSGVVGICANFRESDFDYFVASASDKAVPEGMDELTIAGGLWVVFECVGPMPDAIQAVWKRIFSEWFPSASYEHAGTAEIEWYSDGDGCAADYRSEIWIPIQKKN